MVRRSFVQTANSPEIWLLLASSTFMTSVYAALDPALSQVAHHSDLTRRSLFPPSANAQPAPATVQPQATGTPPANSACAQPPLSNSTWIQLGIDNYLANLPGGTSLNLQHYAASVGAPDFICGIGDKCQAGQLCSPVQAPGWEVLVAAQEWNNYQNKFYEAVGTAVQMVTSVSSALVVDMYPPNHTGHIWDIFSSFSLAAGITSGVIGFLLMLVQGAAVIATPLSLLTLTTVAITFGVVGVISMQEAVKKRGPNAFDKFSVYAFYLSEWQKHAQKSISNSTRSVIAAGVSSPEGISTVLKNGTFFRERPLLNEAEIVSSLKNTTTVRILTDILRSQGAFVTIASDKCTDKGPGGAWKGNNKLSYCSPNGTMFNIIHSSKKKAHNTWWNAELISKKYGISVEYLTAQSYFCQLNHGTANFDPYKSTSFPQDLSAECISNLPVCDFRNPDLAEAKKEKNTIHACRNVAKLPI
ncbi:hypothetical protein MJO29_013505 [Puccinia striiformis f. sp. tritici]|uniref:DUF7872 domain-containing protein n=1 Tax=Puccinia striiformis f. sp. tritici PST-78 TaxID=1165861 RepID=A0A0L0VWN9_9BASI|nr:hypothetical protein Pst134EA_025831 [Puccinia striiformis f. sp. tritici]KAH9451890.1 hypothetical protein Pst134EA_025831 [Puccinia striiformis f. sp. tritici]KAI7941431.1 hypothetical protein MJO29_013505 [Puccinia striiformis f. sp. tritici]KAI9625368.1 hypothetical protein KEM48_010940 [Puccinia striiformis f. sp. tritici PST-130]KNF03683.1 hypothetical protein PSTG_03204 [Puccinia striiformis f. sp. tritici PST-78]